VLRPLFEGLRQAMKDSRLPEWQGAQILGANMEGPYLSAAKRGAHREDYLQKPNAALVKEYADVIRLVTIAPEIEGGLSFIRQVTEETDVICSIGHTAADYDTAMQAIEAGCTHATHCFNAMTGLGHREPGVVGAVLSSPEVYTELICDTFHIHPALFSVVAALKKEKLVLITDCIRAGALPDGEYDLGGQAVTVHGIQCRLADGTIAGSVLQLNRGVANVKKHTDLSVPEVIRAASLNPASSIGRAGDKGSLEIGKDADIVLLDKEFNVLSTYGKGRMIYHGKM
jgi:N-acetylglucosamine-6-phosphate deacetylase